MMHGMGPFLYLLQVSGRASFSQVWACHHDQTAASASPGINSGKLYYDVGYTRSRAQRYRLRGPVCWTARRVTPPAFPKPGDGCWEDVAHSICMTCATATAAYKPHNLTSYHDVSILGTPDPTSFSLFSLPAFSLGLIRRTVSACSRTMARYINALSSSSGP
ncbi:hypothetical protein BU16DRAFT_227760 [Lophium mytilinum]|uniref:Uncharacterized protein n=1 Tax=Lophium mytilinum TaxID=390894 RepID=A0A6A6Q865_9PEZI|nr:hypothetical protein BU16DRAFT_227760 [Lophium mytilinum]